MFAAMGAPIELASPSQRALFDPDLIEAVYCCVESTVDCSALRKLLLERIADASVELLNPVRVERIAPENGTLRVALADGTHVGAPCVFNATYSRLNSLLLESGVAPLALKHEFTEVALVQPPTTLAGYGVTVMDGPFFSTMPFPGNGLYSLTHVRFTPHAAWRDEPGGADAYAIAQSLPQDSRWRHMQSDAQRFLPCLKSCRWHHSLFTVKTVPAKNENDDGRPILFRPAPELPGLYSILGSKLDNIYDLFQVVDELEL
jgi:glycine/D-amino acid oxidase-like deaminating enzyme